MKITYDKEVDALYIYFKKGKVARTLKIGTNVITDVDKKGNVIGLEVLDASHYAKNGNNEPRISVGRKSFPLPALAY